MVSANAFTNAKPYKVYLENINTEGEDNISIFVHEPDGTAWYDFALTRRCDCQVGSINSPSNDCNNSFRTTLVGATEIELIRALGVPASTFTSGGSKFLVYSDSGTTKDNYQSSLDYWGNVNTVNYGGNQYSCEVTYEISNKRIKNIRWNGNNCVFDEKNL